MNENGIQFDDLGSSLTYVHDTWILGYSLRKPASPLMSMCVCKGRLHSTRATTTERGGILIGFAKLSGTSFVCSKTYIIVVLQSSTILLEPCLVQITPMQFLAAKSLPKMTGLV